MQWQLAILLLVVLAAPAQATLTLDFAQLPVNPIKPSEFASLAFFVRADCSDVLKEDAEATVAGIEGRPLLGVNVRTESALGWRLSHVAWPPMTLAYYTVDVAHCQAYPTESLEWFFAYTLRPDWTMTAGELSNVTVEAWLSGSDAWFFGPTPLARATIPVSPARDLQVHLYQDWPTSHSDTVTEITASGRIHANFPVVLNLESRTGYPSVTCDENVIRIAEPLEFQPARTFAKAEPGPDRYSQGALFEIGLNVSHAPIEYQRDHCGAFAMVEVQVVASALDGIDAEWDVGTVTAPYKFAQQEPAIVAEIGPREASAVGPLLALGLALALVAFVRR